MKKISGKYPLWVLILIGLLNLLQAIYTPISGDEAYYYMYAQHPDWGYFDHPPMVAVFIKLSEVLGNTNLRVRLLTVLLSALNIWLLWLIARQKGNRKPDFLVLALISMIIPVFHIFGFITTPDAPLLFFSILYVWMLNRFLDKKNFFNGIFLGLIMALVLYSKYLGVVLIGVTLLLRHELWKTKWFYLSLVTGIFLYLPHLYWQWQHDFISFKFHLFKRDLTPLNLEDKLKYGIGGMLLIINPLLLYLLLKKEIRSNRKWQDFYANSFYLILIFFFLLTFKTSVQAHWISFAAPLLVLALDNLSKSVKYWLKIAIPVLLLLLIARLIIILPLPLPTEFHKERKEYFSKIKQLAEGRHVVFVNSYQRASKYTFYTGDSALSFNNIYYRKNQYDLWNYDSFHGKNILLIGAWPSKIYQQKFIGKDTLLYKKMDSFVVFNRLKARILNKKQIQTKDTLHIEIYNPHKHSLVVSDNLNKDIRLMLGRKKENGKFVFVGLKPLNEKVTLKPGETKTALFIKQTGKTEKPNENWHLIAQHNIFQIFTE